MKVRFFNYYRQFDAQPINIGDTVYGNYLGYASVALAETLVEHDIHIVQDNTYDVAVFVDADEELFEQAKALSAHIKKILLLVESPIYTPFPHHPNVFSHPVWSSVVSYNREYEAPHVIHYDIAVTGTQCPLPSVGDWRSAAIRGGFIGSYKNDHRGYTAQRDALLLQLADADMIDIYGANWPAHRNCKGLTENKIETLAKYKYCIACENALYSGYVTKKVGDCILAERPSLYFGDEKNARRRFGKTFIPLHDLSYATFANAKAALDSQYEALQAETIVQKQLSQEWVSSYVQVMAGVLSALL